MPISDLIPKFFSTANSNQIGQAVEEQVQQALMRRRNHERRWYDNQFFDDGMHFRLVSKRTGRVIDSVNRSTGYVERAIPRASRQIRGIGNLMFSPEYYPVVYPERTTAENFRNKITGQVDELSYKNAIEVAKHSARKRGIWIQTMWEDELDLPLKIIEIILGAAKQSINYLQVYTDPHTSRICVDTLDGFDLIHFGDYKWLDELPFITKAIPWDFQEVLNYEFFDEEKRAKLTPDNQYATSEIKNAYMRTRYGTKSTAASQNSIIVKESFIKEYLTSDNWDQAKKLSEDTGAMEGKSKGDMIMRHPYSAGGVTLHDEYIDYDNYPFADFRFEPGFLYQVPLIERFIPLNKSLDIIIGRLEKWVNAMVVGVYMTRKGENMQLTNFPGGQQVTYENQAPQQMNVTNAGPTPFQLAEILDKYIEEQGASTFTLNNLPQGVTANAAFESSQQREYANMKFATMMLKKTISKVAQLMMERADKDYIKPQEISYKENGEPSSFTVIGAQGKAAHDKIQAELPKDIITLDRKAKIRVEVDQGLGLTTAGKKEAMTTIMNHLIQLYQLGFLSASALSLAIKRELETYGYGSTEEFMEEVENGVTNGQMSNNQMMQMQMAVVKALKDAQVAGPEADKRLVDSTKLGVLQTMKDAGLLDQLNQEGKTNIEVDDLVKLYHDAPDDVRRQIEQKLGFSPSQAEPISPSQAESAERLHKISNEKTKTQLEATRPIAKGGQ